MSRGLVYFLAGPTPPTPDWARAAGLGYVLGSSQSMPRNGPATIPPAGNGTLWTGTGKPGSRPHWEEHPLRKGVWVGWDPDCPPKPEDLARPKQQAGHWVKLADGNEWLIPVARRPAGGSPFPRRIKFDAAGEPAVDAQPSDAEHRWLWEQACRYWDAVTMAAEAADGQATTVQVTVGDTIQLAARALALNYRLSTAEVSMLGLLSTDLLSPICDALCDWPSLAALMGTAEEPPRPNSAGPARERGPEDSAPTTAQPLQTSTP